MKFKPDGVRSLRLQSGMTQRAFAAVLGTSQARIDSWEGGYNVPSAHYMGLLFQFARDRDLTPKFLVEGKQPAVKRRGAVQLKESLVLGVSDGV